MDGSGALGHCIIYGIRFIHGTILGSEGPTRGRMDNVRLSDFWRLMDDEFGAGYSRVLASELVLSELGGLSAQAALSSGIEPRLVWSAICEKQDVPASRRLGRDIAPKK